MNDRYETYHAPSPMTWAWVVAAVAQAEDYTVRGHKAMDGCHEDSCMWCPLDDEDCPAHWLYQQSAHAAFDAGYAQREWASRVARWPSVQGFSPAEY